MAASQMALPAGMGSSSSSSIQNEDTPLLLNADEERQSEDIPLHLRPMTPIPYKPIFILCIMRFSEPISFNLIFPFINEMIESVGISNPGYSSGLIEGTFAFAQLLTVFQWGSLSDRIGRRPVLLLGLGFVALFTCLFGLSTSFMMILLFRFLIGLSNGNVAVLKSAIAELTDETNQGRAFSFLPLSWSIGSVVAPMIGGYLARPAEKYPDVFGSVTLFINYPYLLPCLVGASITAIGWLVGFFFLEESLGGREKQKKLAESDSTPITTPNYGTVSSSRADSSVTLQDTTPVKLSAREILADVFVRRVLVSYMFLAVVTVSVDAILVLWLHMPIHKGGIGFTTSQIGVVLSSIGILATFINLVLFPPLQRRFGTVSIYRAAMALQIPIVLSFPVIRLIAVFENGMDKNCSGVPGTGTKAGMAVLVLLKCAGGIIFACNMILVSASAPSRTSLGAVNGVAQMVASSMRAIGPTVATIVFAVSTDERYRALGGQLIWLYLVIVSIAGVFAAWRVQEGRPAIQSAKD